MVHKKDKKTQLPAVTTRPSQLQSQHTLTQYMTEISKYPILTPEEEVRLAKLYHDQKDLEALRMLVQSNLRFVVKVATEYSKFGSRILDLIQEGNLGLLQAIKKFNPYKEIRLITYAVWWIRGAIQEYLLKQHSLMKIGTTPTQKKLFYHLRKQNLPEIASTKDLKHLSETLNISEKEIKEMQQRLASHTVSLDSTSDSSFITKDFLNVNEVDVGDDLQQKQEIRHLKSSVDQVKPLLNPKELYILENRTLSDFPKTLQAIGHHFGVTRESIRQIEDKLLKKIREKFQST